MNAGDLYCGPVCVHEQTQPFSILCWRSQRKPVEQTCQALKEKKGPLSARNRSYELEKKIRVRCRQSCTQIGLHHSVLFIIDKGPLSHSPMSIPECYSGSPGSEMWNLHVHSVIFLNSDQRISPEIHRDTKKEWQMTHAETDTSVSFNKTWSSVWPWLLAISVGVCPWRLAVCSARSAPGHCKSRPEMLLNPYWAAKWSSEGTSAQWCSVGEICPFPLGLKRNF